MRKLLLLVTSIVLFSAGALAQRTVTGVVSLNDTGEPEPGVNVVVTGTTNGTITDFDGKYSVTVPSGKSITFSYLGYKSQTIEPNGNVVDVLLEPESQELDEVVAVGYGSMRKSDLTGSVSSVKAADLVKTPASGVDQALQGKAAGVTVNANSGQPGAAAEVRIRGIGTVLSDASPIYVVDGVITKDIGFLSPNDIASMEVLKDASSTAIYGAQAANGVVLITTKGGGDKERPANISFNAYWGWQNRWKKLDLMGRDEQVKMETLIEGKASTMKEYQDYGFYTKDQYGNTRGWWDLQNSGSKYYPINFDYSKQETDWQDEVFKKNAFMHNYHLSIDGSTKVGSYMFSASYFNQDGTIKGSNYERLTLRLNTNFKVRSWFKIGENLAFSASSGRNAMNNSSSAGASVISAALAMAPWDPTHYPKGSINNEGKDISGQPAAGSNFKNVTNPFSMIEYSEPSSKAERWVGDLFLEFTPVEGLTIRPSLSLDLSNVRDRNFKYAYEFSSYDQNTKNYLSTSMTRYYTLTNDNVITYARDIKKHSFSVMAGESMQQYDYYNLGAASTGILNDRDPNNWYLNKTTNEEDKTAGDGVDRQRRLSFFSRLHYCFDNRYLLTVNFRADASSKFKKSNNSVWGFFPSVAAAWRISEEKFMKKYSKLDYMKLRFGWGRIGNDQVGETSFVQTMETPGPYYVGYVLGQAQQSPSGAAVLIIANENGKWETTETWNVGYDFGFWNGMLTGTVEGFVRDTKDAIMPVVAPAHVGNMGNPWWNPKSNIGTVRNAGIELTLGHNYSVRKFSYGISANLSFIKNELIAMNGASVVTGDRTKTDQGMPVSSFWGYKYLGVYKDAAEAAKYGRNIGDAIYEDRNNDGKIDENDNTYIGSAFPWLTGSLSFNCDFYGVDVSLFFQGVYGNQIYNALRERTEGTGLTNTLSKDMNNVCIYYNDAQLAALAAKGINGYSIMEEYNGDIPNPKDPYNSQTSSRFIEDGSYLRLKNLTIGYTIPSKYTKKAYINRLRVYFSANNLLTLTKYSGYDPEVGGGVDYGNYPQSRTFMFGINLDF